MSKAKRPSTAGARKAATLGLRERKKLETHRALHSAARRLVAERGLANVTVEDIAAEADVATRTFFNYFDSKEGAVVDAPPGAAELMATFLDGRPATEPPLESLRLAWVDYFTALAPGLRELVGLVTANPALAERHTASFAEFHDVIVEWAADRHDVDPVASIYPELLAIVGGATIQLICKRWQPDDGPEALTALIDEVHTLLAQGLVLR